MVEDRITDGTRIAELLASELDGREDGALEAVAVTNADRDVEPTTDGARAYDVVLGGSEGIDDADRGEIDDANEETDSDPFAQVFVHEDRARLEFKAGQDAAATAGEDVSLRVRPKASRPPRTLVFVESGAEVKRATDVVQAVVRSVRAGE